MANTSAKDQARQTAEARQLDSEDGSQDSAGRDTNTVDQTVHDEGELEHRAHDEDTDRQTDELYDMDGDNEVLEWKRHSDLDAPPARDGYVNRFIRIRLGIVRDTARLRNAMREGWRPVRASSVSDRSLPTVHLDNNFGDVIGVEDLILCEMPRNVYLKRQKYFRDKRTRQNQAIERQLRNQSSESAPGFGPIEQQRSSSVSRAQPRSNVAVADDEI